MHSKISSAGGYSLDQITRVARRYGVDAVFLSDNLTDTIEYGLPPLRHVLWMNYSRPSVMTVGPQAYLDMIEAENRRQSDVLYVPGVEVCPRFYWTGALSGTNLVCHDHQRNLIAVGTTNAAVVSSIPEARGYVWRKDRLWIMATRLLVILFLMSCLAMRRLSRFLARYSTYSRQEILRSYIFGMVAPIALLALAVNVAASRVPAFDIYGEDKAVRHEQRTVDFLNENGVVHYWAHPEATDDNEFSYLGVGFKAHTEPYPEILSRTEGSGGFGGVYEDRNTLTEPGALWDRVLKDYVEGRRRAPLWCYGEMLYHYEGQAGKKFGNVETMVWAGEKTTEALLNSLREGRFYARNNRGNESLALEEWKAQPDDLGRVDVLVRVTSRADGEKVKVQLIRNGQIAKQVDGTTPLQCEFHDVAPAGAGMSCYRAVVLGVYPLRLVTNPLFVRAKGQKKSTTDYTDDTDGRQE